MPISRKQKTYRKLNKNKFTKPSRSSGIFGNINIFLGFLGIILILSGLYLYINQTHTEKVPEILQKNQFISFKDRIPANLYIPALNKYIQVETGSITNGIWYISKNKATYLTRSGIPGETGNIVIYGHNKKSIFGDLVLLKPGDPIIIETIDKNIFRYIVTKSLTVDPDNISIAYPTPTERLTLYTCTGLFDSKRLVIQAIPKI